MPTAYAFVDGGYLRSIATHSGHRFYNPRSLANKLATMSGHFAGDPTKLARTIYFDAAPDETPDAVLAAYWNAVEILSDTHLGFGWLRGKSNRRGPRQKAVDTLLAVEMLSGAYTSRYGVAILVSGDADFVPVVNEVRKAGPHVVVAAATDPSGRANFECSEDLRRAADRFLQLPSDASKTDYSEWFKQMEYTAV